MIRQPRLLIISGLFLLLSVSVFFAQAEDVVDLPAPPPSLDEEPVSTTPTPTPIPFVESDLQLSGPRKLPAGVAGAMSILPGLGQAVNGNVAEGALWFAATAGAAAVRPYIAFNIWQYNLYDAYRDAKPENGRYKDNTWYENYLGGLNPFNVLDPIGGPFTLLYGAIPGYVLHHGNNYMLLKPVGTAFIGAGEEALFRGFLFPAFSDLFGSKWIGGFVSSALFGAAHFQYNWGGRAVVAGFGGVACLQLDLNDYDLRKNIFMHTWVDFFLLPRGIGPLENPKPKKAGEKDDDDSSKIDIKSALLGGIGIRLGFAF